MKMEEIFFLEYHSQIGQKTQHKYGPHASPFQQLNGFCYHKNGLENMMIAASIGGRCKY